MNLEAQILAEGSRSFDDMVQFFSSNRERIFFSLLKKGFSREVAEEAVQNAAVSVCRGEDLFEKFREADDGRLLAYLTKIAWNEARQISRKNQHSLVQCANIQAYSQNREPDPLQSLVAQEIPLPPSRRDIFQRAREIVSGMTQEHKEAYELLCEYPEELSEILGSRMNITGAAYRKRISRIRSAFREDPTLCKLLDAYWAIA